MVAVPELPALLKISANDDINVLNAIVHQIEDENRGLNTKAAYFPKINEYQAYCDHVYKDDVNKYHLNQKRMFNFIFYQAFREQKTRGGKRCEQPPLFDKVMYDAVVSKYKTWQENHASSSNYETCPEPQKPVHYQTITTYRAALRKVWQVQVASSITSLSWDNVWTVSLQSMYDMVKKRRARINKKNYKEKVDHDFAPYMCLEHVPDIESAFWMKGCHGTHRGAFSSLRNRSCFLYTFRGVLRHESLNSAELSDMLMVAELKTPQDPHPLDILVNQLATGKFLLIVVCLVY